jgi:conflict system STAND superfamily ATPase
MRTVEDCRASKSSSSTRYFNLSRGTLVAQRERARVERLECPKDATVDGHLGDADCPYKGLRAFEHEDAALFFGREAPLEAVLARLAETRFVAVIGASGSGKSSFVRAGLLAAISTAAAANGGAGARVALLTPGAHPVDELATAVGAAIGDTAAGLTDDLRADPHALQRRTCEGGDGGLMIAALDGFPEEAGSLR